jgi:YVTN family beta-propeller protein
VPQTRRLLLCLLAGALVLPAVAAAGAPRTAYVTDQGADQLARLDVFTNSALGTIPVRDGPRGIAVTPDGATAYVVNQWDNTVTPVDTSTNAAGPAIAVGFQPTGIAITPDGATAYVTNITDNTVTPIATATDTAGAPIAVGAGPLAVAISPDGATAYVANTASGDVTPVDTATNTAGPAIALGGSPSGIAITPDGATAYVSGGFGGSNWVVPISLATGTPGAAIPVASWPWTVAITPDGATAYVTNATSNAVTPIATASNVAGAPIAVGSYPSSVSITPDGSSAYVTNLGDDTVSVISTLTNTVTTTLTGHPEPFGIGIVPDQAPGAAFTSQAGPAGSATTFDASGSSDPDGSVASYRWSFGDGQTATTAGPTAAHVYADARAYSAVLTVVDDEGCSMATVFTGQTAFCNGSTAARIEHQVSVPTPPPPGAPGSPGAPAQPDPPKALQTGGRAIQRFGLASRCVRASSTGKARVGLRLLLARPMPVQVKIDRALGTTGRSTCPRPSRMRHFPGAFKQVDEVERTSTRPTIAAVSRRLTLGVRLAPGLYRITVRAYTGQQKLSHRARRWVRVLS